MSDDARNVEADTSSRSSHQESSYRQRIERTSPLLDSEDEDASDPEAAQPDIETLRSLAEGTDQKGSAFQSVAVAAVQILDRALSYEREAAEAALSLGQQEKLESMVETIERAAALLRKNLDAQGGTVMHLCAKGDRPAPPENQPWWFALTDALEVLEEGTGRMTSLTTAQPADSPARELSQCIAQLLRGHHDELLLEADDWIS